jgi:hypothetical protein
MAYTRSAYLGSFAPERVPGLKRLLTQGAQDATVNIFVHENVRTYTKIAPGFFRDWRYERSESDLTVDVWDDNAGLVDDYVTFFVPEVCRGSIHPLESYRRHLGKS